MLMYGLVVVLVVVLMVVVLVVVVLVLVVLVQLGFLESVDSRFHELLAPLMIVLESMFLYCLRDTEVGIV